MIEWKELIINTEVTILGALNQLNDTGFEEGTLFVTEENGTFLGTLTDGDIRRGLLKNINTSAKVSLVVNTNPAKLLLGHKIEKSFLDFCEENRISLIPMLDENHKLVEVVQLNSLIRKIPVEVFILAGGKGQRLMPLTKDIPKPMLKVGEKPILEHNIDRLAKFGVSKFYISVNYLSEVISDYFKDGSKKKISIDYVYEDKPLGTLGSITMVKYFATESVLIMNSDLLTNIDYADFYQSFVSEQADIMIATIPYHVDLPYAILETEGSKVTNLEEKPRYTYHANAGIYLVKKGLLDKIEKNTFYNATDLIDLAIKKSKKVSHYNILSYWLDIGKLHDFTKAQIDIKHLHI